VAVPFLDFFIKKVKLEPTHARIISRLDDYDRKVIFNDKQSTNGAYYVRRICEQNGFSLRRVRVCGVNTCSCVLESVLCLAREFCEIVEVVQDACNDPQIPTDWAAKHPGEPLPIRNDWSKFLVQPNVKLLSTVAA
jgi:hypothetical protein